MKSSAHVIYLWYEKKEEVKYKTQNLPNNIKACCVTLHARDIWHSLLRVEQNDNFLPKNCPKSNS